LLATVAVDRDDGALLVGGEDDLRFVILVEIHNHRGHDDVAARPVALDRRRLERGGGERLALAIGIPRERTVAPRHAHAAHARPRVAAAHGARAIGVVLALVIKAARHRRGHALTIGAYEAVIALRIVLAIGSGYAGVLAEADRHVALDGRVDADAE